MYVNLIFSPAAAEAGPVIVTLVATVSANVVDAFAVTVVLSAFVAVNVYSAAPNLAVEAPTTEQ